MATSCAPKRLDAGLTLLELLVAMAVAATVASFVAVSLSVGRPDRALDDAASGLANDLRAARIYALQTGQPLQLLASTQGYQIEALEVERDWPSGIEAQWRDSLDADQQIIRFVFSPGRINQRGLQVQLSDGERQTMVNFGAVTGRVDVSR